MNTRLSFGLLCALAAIATGCDTGQTPNTAKDMATVVEPDLAPDCNLNPKACGQCTSDNDCEGGTPRCNLATKKCAACVPTNDNCPQGQVCVDMGGGVLGCGTMCTKSSDCIKLAGGGDCCSGICRNTTNDTSHCGGCGIACGNYANAATVCSGGTCTMGACSAGHSDCNKSDGDGCEVRSDDDIDNCGACNMKCPRIVGGTAACAAGKCSSKCNTGQLDCDNNLANGCEVDATYDPKNCGKCGMACAAPANAVPFCDQGACGFRCKVGYADCNKDAKDGCELEVRVDVANCGRCGNVCPNLPNASPACNNGLCGVGQCDQNWGDCDKNPGNGCEAGVEKDINNCGACGKACKNGGNGPTQCVAGACQFTCAQGWTDCNNDPVDGCESQTSADSNNCGGCGMKCPMNLPACVNSMCTNARNCSVEARAWCMAKGWKEVAWSSSFPNQPGGSIFCTSDGRSAGNDCDACGTYNQIIWKNTAKDACNSPMMLVPGKVYAGHNPCSCAANNYDCGVWDMKGCIPD